MIVACVLVAALTAGGFSSLKEKEYTASAKLLFSDPDFARRSVFSPPADAARVVATYLQLDVLTDVSELTSDVVSKSRLDGASELTPDDISAMVSVIAAGDSDLVSIDATAAGSKLSALVANTFARQLIDFRARRDRSRLNAGQRAAERQFDRLSATEQTGPEGQALKRSATRLGAIAALQTGHAEFVMPAAAPASPTSPKPIRNGVLGAMLGLVAGLGLVAFLERSNRPKRTT